LIEGGIPSPLSPKNLIRTVKSLSDIRRADLEDYVFPGTDAAVQILDVKLSESELDEAYAEIPIERRYYPTAKGWKVKFPFWHVSAMMELGDAEFPPESGFVRERKGWDHEHCSFCQAHIGIGELCYTLDHEEGGVYIICKTCSEQCQK
jgi:hypothetical protein